MCSDKMKNWNKLGATALIGLLIIGVAGCVEEGEVRTPEPGTPSIKTPTGTTTPTPTPTSTPEKLWIEGLASIDSVLVHWENWDADLEKDGYEIKIWFDDTKGHWMHFTGIPLNVTVKLYIQHYDEDSWDWGEPELLHTWDITITSSEDIIRIPFEGYCERPGGFIPKGSMDVIVHTPEQGDFEGRTYAILCPMD